MLRPSETITQRGLRAQLWLVAGLTFLFACGGKLDSDEGSDAPGDVQSGTATDDSSPAGSGMAGSVKLGSCHLGFAPDDEPTRDCNWLGHERCYDTKLAACACLCPIDSPNSICLSDFYDGPNSKTEVKCY